MTEAPEPKKSFFDNVFWIGTLSFFGGISQDIFLPILPLYLANVLNYDKAFIGITAGLVTASAALFKIVSGYLSDKFKKNKPIIFVGYFLSLISRPLLAIFTGGAAVLGLRFLDGVGKGIKDSPKDVLIGASTKKETRGRGFGIARMLDTLGSVAGPILLFVLLEIFKDNPLKYHYILYVTALPLIFTLGIIILKVKETRAEAVPPEHLDVGRLSAPAVLPSRFWIFLVIMAFFTIGNSSDAFLILRAQNVGVTLLAIPLVYALFNFVYAALSVPLGSLSDRIGREKVILFGFLAYSIAYFGFGLAKTSLHIWLLFAFYGIYYATTEGVAKAFISDLVGSEFRGRAYGIYNSAIALMTLPASFIAGFLWDKISPAAPFFFGGAVSLLATIFLGLFLTYQNLKSVVKN